MLWLKDFKVYYATKIFWRYILVFIQQIFIEEVLHSGNFKENFKYVL